MEKLKDYLPESIQGKNILITGSTTGIGRATALMLSQLGANVLITGLTKQHMEDTLADISKISKGKVYDVMADLSMEEGIMKLFQAVDTHFGKLDILINNAAIPYESITEGNYREWKRVVDTNLLAYMACCSEAFKRMKGDGHIVNIGSMSADVREESGSVYVATKSGIQGFSEAFRTEANKKGIKLTLIEPGAVDTDMQEQTTEEKKRKVEAMEMLEADDIAISILYCLSQPKRCDVVELKVRPHRQYI